MCDVNLRWGKPTTLARARGGRIAYKRVQLDRNGDGFNPMHWIATPTYPTRTIRYVIGGRYRAEGAMRDGGAGFWCYRSLQAARRAHREGGAILRVRVYGRVIASPTSRFGRPGGIRASRMEVLARVPTRKRG